MYWQLKMFAKLLRPQLKGLLKTFPRCCKYYTRGIFYHTLSSHNNISRSNIESPISQPLMRTVLTGELYDGQHALSNDVQSHSIEEERVANIEQQQRNRCNLVIVGIPEYIKDEELQQAVIKIFQNLNDSLDEKEIVKVYRLNRGHTVCQFVDHDSLVKVLTSRRHDEVNIGGIIVRIFIRQHLTKEFAHLNYAIRVAKRKGKIFHYRISLDGVNQVRLSTGDNEYYDITHRSDLKNKGLYFLEGYRSPETKEEKVEEERECYKNLQMQRMDSVAITGLPEHARVDETSLMREVLTILQPANPSLDEKHIVKVFQAGSKVICRFVDQECVTGILRSKFSIPGVYIEPSLIQQYADIYEVLRMAKRNGRILHHRLTHDGIHQVQLSRDGHFYDISHETDLISAGLSLDEETSLTIEEERNRYKYLQKQRRNSVAISGIPQHVEKVNLQHDVLNILQTVTSSIDESDILHVFRLGPQVVCKFKDHLYAMDILKDSARLQSTSGGLYGEESSIYIEYSLIKEYAHLNYAIRKAYENGKLHSYRVHDGINQIKLHKHDLLFKNITHKMDLISLGLYLEVREL